jgi:hypothetical protein
MGLGNRSQSQLGVLLLGDFAVAVCVPDDLSRGRSGSD